MIMPYYQSTNVKSKAPVPRLTSNAGMPSQIAMAKQTKGFLDSSQAPWFVFTSKQETSAIS